MFLLDRQQLIWTASDLTQAAECEYKLLRIVDWRLKRIDALTGEEDPLMNKVAELGDRHEAHLLAAYEKDGAVIRLPRSKYSRELLELTDAASREAFLRRPKVVYQAGFFDGEFHGYADFVELQDDGWLVCDAKLARSAKPRALLQLGAYAEQLLRMELPLSSHVALLLGNGKRAQFRIDDVLPVFRARRARLRQILSEHHAGGLPIQWNDPRYTACGRCDECAAAAEVSNDVLRVAGLSTSHRRKLRAVGIQTMADLADAATGPADMNAATFHRIRAQARLQWAQCLAGPDAPVRCELLPTAPTTLALLPAPSDGDLFFDFEGYPLYDEGDPARTGLEYLWGIMDKDECYAFPQRWAHSFVDERASFIAFMDFVAARRKRYPDLHIYHYAPYETTALRRLAQTYQVKLDELDTLLRDEVFVDLYSTVRGSIRVSADSYSIKKLEPLYMGSERRDQDGVTSGGDSIIAYQEYRDLRDADAAQAQKRLDELEDYNRYDCLSTLRLRDWLLERAKEAGIFHLIQPRSKAGTPAQESAEAKDATNNPQRQQLSERLQALGGDGLTSTRTDEQQGYAMLAAALNYHRLERNVFWWEHFSRLGTPIEDWSDTRGVFVVEQAEIVSDWAHPGGRARNLRRELRLIGDWAPGSRPADKAYVIYGRADGPADGGPEAALYAAAPSMEYEWNEQEPSVVKLTESRPADATYAGLPVALTPDRPISTKNIEAAIEHVARKAATAGTLPDGALYDLLRLRHPRTSSGLPHTGQVVEDIVSALVGMEDSYLAIQGPPGTGKTFTASRVIKTLVERRHWRIGVVAQSHAVIENLLDGIVKAGLAPSLIGKTDAEAAAPSWSEIGSAAKDHAAFLESNKGSGCVLGATVFKLAHPDMAARPLDLLVIDEAGQYSLANTIAASWQAKRLLLLGDPQQLPQVSQAIHAAAVNEAALGWLMKGHSTLPPEYGYFLADSYRMHPKLCERVSKLSYERRLQSANKAGERSLAHIAPGIAMVEVQHSGNRTESMEEASVVVATIQERLGKPWRESRGEAERPLAPSDFLVVAPYNAQVALIRRQLDAAGFTTVKVGTVDKFQGQEAPIAVVSMTASSSSEVPRGMGFLLNRNRVNVAVSRAKWQAVVIRSKDLTSYMPGSVDQLLELGGFLGLGPTIP
jgi:predicted RecB family nuclease